MKSSVLLIASTMAVGLLFGAPSLAADKPAAATKSSVERNKESARVWYEEAIVKENPKSLDTILAKGVTVEFAPSFVSSVTNSNKLSGMDQVKKHVVAANKNADYSGAILDIVGEGNKVAMYRVVTEKMADGRTAVVPWVSFFEFDDAGKITKIKHVHDTLGEKQQLDKSAKKK